MKIGTFTVACRVSNIVDRHQVRDLAALLVDSGSEYTWINGKLLEEIGIVREKKDLHFIMANGEQVTRSVGFGDFARREHTFTIDEVVFAKPGDLLLLGARTLEGLNLTIDARLKKLVAAGPLHAA